MKLIDLLVQHLGSQGGWPIGAEVCAQDNDGEVCFYTEKGIHRRGGCAVWSIPVDVQSKLVKRRIFFIQAEDMVTSVVCREQYEAALAASKQVEWSGDGLPPVGCECEFFNGDRYDCRGSVPKDGAKVKIVAHDKSEIGTDIAVFTWTGMDGALHAEACTEMLFRPIRTETERKLEDGVADLQKAFLMASDTDDVGQVIWDHIAEGKIPGIKLAD